MEEIPLEGNTCPACGSHNVEMERLQNEFEEEIERITFESEELSASLQDAEAVVYEKDEKIKSLELSLSIEQETRMSLDADLRNKTNECLSLLQSLETYFPSVYTICSLLAEMMARLGNARTAAEEITLSLQETATSLSEQLNRIAAEKDELANAKDRAEQEVAELKAKLEGISQQLEESKNASTPSNSGEVDQLKDETEKLKQKILEMELNHQRKVADITAMYESQSQFVEILTRKVEQFKQEKAEWITERKSYESQIEVLKNETSAATVMANNQCSVSQAQVDELTYQIADLTKFKEDQCQIVDNLTKNVQHLESEKSDWTMERERLTSQIEDLKHQKESAEKQRNEREASLTELNEKNSELSQQLQEARGSLDALQEKINSLEMAMSDLNEKHIKQIEQLKSESEKKLNDFAITERQYEQIRSDYEEAMERIHELSEEKETTASELLRLREALSEKQDELTSLRAEQAKSDLLYEEAKKKIESLDSQLHRGEWAAQAESKKATITGNDGEGDYVPNVSTRSSSPTSSPRSPSASYNGEWNCDNGETNNHHQTEGSTSHAQVTQEPLQDPRVTSSDEFCEFCSGNAKHLCISSYDLGSHME
ncbi:hypothetical protein ANCCAN_03802 [Ancylostoma caninum]|uniref:Uncharacterized protein n=1 Tax=Ancylostoma caninum TaxID=29170 RepID=A0A368H4L6_ANCCA|nr:hypothetical protein ANCCAN_03802 [Ancylostoma caninum]